MPTEEQATAAAELVDTRGGGGGVGGIKVSSRSKPNKSKKGSSPDGQAAAKVEGPTYEEMADNELRAQLKRLADQVRASSCVNNEYGDDGRTDWTETESDKELQKALLVAIEKKVSLEELDFSWANLAKMK